MSLEQKLEALMAEVAEIKKVVLQKYAWDEKVSESGIQIAGGPTTVEHQGYFKGAVAVPTPQGVVFAFVLQDEISGKFAILGPEFVRPVK
jgi:hypothetical protein